jgi:AcrR family transcriptional regulator
MAPRTYTQDKRAEGARHTRERILDATLDLYIERGVADTTLKSVAEKADVSRGTILHHFGSGDGLLGEVLDRVIERLEIPDGRVFDGVTDREARIRAYVRAMSRFHERSVTWWSTFEGEMQRPALQKREAYYWGEIWKLQAAALGPELANDKAANAALLSVIHPATTGTFFWSYEQAGLDREAAARLLEDLAVDAVRRVTDRKKGRGGLS